MAALTPQNRRNPAGDPLNDLLDDTDMRGASSRARPRSLQQTRESHSSVWWIAAAASLVWIASVLAFSWSRYAMPNDPGSVLDAARDRIDITDWLLVGAAITGPLLLIWVIAWLISRSMELRDESRRLAKAAILLADAAEASEQRTEQLLLPSANNKSGVVDDVAPTHLNREIERATHAMGALQTQMSAMEEALAKQAAAFDDAAERTAEKVRLINQGGTAIPAAVRSSDTLIVEEDLDSAPSEPDASEAGVIVSEAVSAPAPTAPDEAPASATDLSLDTNVESQTDKLRAGLKAASESASWKKLIEDTPKKATDSANEPVEAPQPASESQTGPEKLDPFESIVSASGKTAAALGAGVAATTGAAMTFGADRDDIPEAPIPDSRLDSAIAEAPAAPTPPKDPLAASREENFEFLARALDWKKFVRAANFPEDESDTETLDALYDVLTDPEAAALLQSAEDTLATLADLDLYMEDFVPEMSPVTAWRAHLQGGQATNGETLIGITSPIEQSRISAKIASDTDFGKLSERFADRFVIIMKRLLAEAGEDKLALELADTRTGRAYLLLLNPLGRLQA